MKRNGSITMALKKKRDAKIGLRFSGKIDVLFYGRISNIYRAVFFKVPPSQMWSGCLRYYKKKKKEREKIDLNFCSVNW